MPKVELEPAGAARAETLENLFQFYVHDFSDFWPVRRVEFREDGRFPTYPPLARYWTEPDRSAFLIRADGNIAGFVMLDHQSHSGQPVDWNMGEFWVARPYRREGVGRVAARQAIAPRPGKWELAVARLNTGAQSFWCGVAAELAQGPVEEIDQDDARWNGLILRLAVA
ncbi:MAG: GNAT family N-acetyltransferase [Caulobacterales bacterium]|nr:GNAT family N-acetyltransferase [Caulobacterales bacterium]